MKLPNLIKKISLVFLSSLLFVNSMAMPFSVAKAQDEPPSTWYNQGFTEWYAKVYGEESPPSEIFGERYTAAQVQWILYSLFSFPINFLGSKMQTVTACLYAVSNPILNINDLSCAQDIASLFTDAFKLMNMSGIISTGQGPSSFTEVVVYDFQNRQLSGINYAYNMLSKFSLTPTANAQGFGYGAVDGLQKYWQGFRDMAYALSVLVVIVFAFMIMFRVKLSPQLVISVQSALPKIVGALILATFSYAIAGFVIDLSYVVGGLFASLMSLAGFVSTNGQQGTPFQIAFEQIMPIQGTQNVGGFYILFWMFGYTVAFFLTAVIALLSTIVGLSVYGIVAGLVMVLLSIWILILMVVYMIKVPWVLLKNLVSLFVSIVVAPIQIVAGALIPSIGFGIWFRKIIAEALVFPLTGLFMFLAGATLQASIGASGGQMLQGLASLIGIQVPQTSLWAPPILGSSADMAGIIWLSVSFVFITMIPKAVDIMKMLVMGAKFDYGSAIGEAAAPLKTIGGAGIQYVTSSAEGENIRAAKRAGYPEVPPIWWVNILKRAGMAR